MLERLINNLHAMAYRCIADESRAMEFVSEGGLKLTGYSPEELVSGRISLISLIRGDFRGKVKEQISAALAEKKPFELVYPIKTADGGEKWVEDRGQGICSPAGELLCIEGFINDITGYRETEEYLKSKIDTLTRPLGDISVPEFAELFDMEEVQRIQDAFASATGVASIITDPGGRPLTKPSNFCHLCMNIIRRTEKGQANCFTSDSRIGRKNPDGPVMQACLSGGLWDGGSSICVGDQHIASWLVGQVLDESADLEGMIRYAREIGADEGEYRKALENVTRMPREQFAAVCSALFLFAKQLSHLAYSNVLQAREIEKMVTIRTAELRRTNEELEHARAEADAANKAKSFFLANMSHELRTPLNAIIGYSEMLEEEAGEEFVPDLRKISGAGKHLLALINDILDLSKIEAGKLELYLETFEIHKAVMEIVGTTEPLVKKKNNTLTINCPESLGSMHADLTRIRQCMLNLISNAAKFTENGAITLKVSREYHEEGDWIHLSVSDTGIGMTEEQLGRLFQSFSQADASTAKKFGGTGLGLAISRRFCRMMGGEVTVTSRPGEGSTFTMRIPSKVSDPRAKPAIEPQSCGIQQGSLESSAATVLIIDDDPAARELLQRFLQKNGFEVACASDGTEALRLARELRPHVITLDIFMPEMDGWAVLSALKEETLTRDIPVIMIAVEENKGLGFAQGIADFITKPVDRERLLRLLQRYRPGASQPVLVVEDDLPTREMLRKMLEKAGWAVTDAENGLVALERVKEQMPAVILLDLLMPGMDGFEFFAELRREELWRTIPVIVVTSKDVTMEEHRRLNSSNAGKIFRKDTYTCEELLEDLRKITVPGIPAPSLLENQE
ncbi:MAG: response regulator [Candidatus Eremiobacteraeota bacterium]|nr:response regulator [Candidatus Eremiobacteraeota bacterium]